MLQKFQHISFKNFILFTLLFMFKFRSGKKRDASNVEVKHTLGDNNFKVSTDI